MICKITYPAPSGLIHWRKNRIAYPSLGLLYSTDGKPNERYYNYFAKRAHGGAGLVTVGLVGVDYTGSGAIASSLTPSGPKRSLRERRIKFVLAQIKKHQIPLHLSTAADASFIRLGKLNDAIMADS